MLQRTRSDYFLCILHRTDMFGRGTSPVSSSWKVEALRSDDSLGTGTYVLARQTSPRLRILLLPGCAAMGGSGLVSGTVSMPAPTPSSRPRVLGLLVRWGVGRNILAWHGSPALHPLPFPKHQDQLMLLMLEPRVMLVLLSSWTWCCWCSGS